MSLKSGMKSTETGVGAIGTLAPLIGIATDKIPPDQIWIALVVAGAVAAVYVSWRSYLKLKGINGQS